MSINDIVCKLSSCAAKLGVQMSLDIVAIF